MKEFGKEYHLNPGSIIKDKKGFDSFFDENFEFEPDTGRVVAKNPNHDNANTLYVFDDFDEIIMILGIEKAKALVRFLAEEGEKQGKYSIIDSLSLREDVFGEAINTFKNVIAMKVGSESDSFFLLGEKGAENLNRGEMIVRSMEMEKIK